MATPRRGKAKVKVTASGSKVSYGQAGRSSDGGWRIIRSSLLKKHKSMQPAGCGSIITTGLIRPLAVSRRDSRFARPYSFYLLLQWKMGRLQGGYHFYSLTNRLHIPVIKLV